MKSRLSIGLPVLTLALACCTAQHNNPARAQGSSDAAQATAGNSKNVYGQPLRTANDAPYDVKMPISEFMPHVMQYAGDGVWKWQGYIADSKGERSLFPKTDEEWEQAESGGRTLAEVTNLLLLPGRRVDDPAWDKAVIAVRAVALKAAAAAEKHDKDAFFAAGGELDVACDECHVKFDPTFQNQKGR